MTEIENLKSQLAALQAENARLKAQQPEQRRAVPVMEHAVEQELRACPGSDEKKAKALRQLAARAEKDKDGKVWINRPNGNRSSVKDAFAGLLSDGGDGLMDAAALAQDPAATEKWLKSKGLI